MNDTTMNPRLIETEDGRPYFSSPGSTEPELINHILDSNWAKQAFMISDSTFENSIDIKNRYWSSASAKFTDTRLGANLGINCRPQFTPYADIPDKGKLADRVDVNISDSTGNYGLGRYYSEAIDDPAQTIYLRFGKPQFNSLVNFVLQAFNPAMTSLANTGRAPGFFYETAKLVGTIASFIAFPAIATTVLAFKTYHFLVGTSTSKFYTLKPTMHLYWSTVNILVNALAINKGIFPKVINDVVGDPGSGQQIGRPFKLDQSQYNALSEALPEIFRGQALFDMFAMANHAQRLANKRYEDDFNKQELGLNSDNFGVNTKFEGYVLKDTSGDGTHSTELTNADGSTKLGAWFDKVARLTNIFGSETGEEVLGMNDNIGPDGKPLPKEEKGVLRQFAEHMDAEWRDGGAFAIFKVNHTGSVNESFANSVGESDISNSVNGLSAKAREMRFSFANGNILGDTVSAAVGAVKDTVSGVLDGVTMGFSSALAGLAGNGYIDIPKHWQSSNANLPRSSYKLQLISPYGNTFSLMQNIYIPLSMILAGTLPLSTGKQSYTSPFLCELYDRGRLQIKLGMITDLSITRGVSNLGFNTRGECLAIDVTFGITDLSSIMHMPISQGVVKGMDMALDGDNILSDYLAVLAGQDLYSQIYPLSKLKLSIAKIVANTGMLTSPAHWASWTHDSMVFAPINFVMEGIVRQGNMASREGI